MEMTIGKLAQATGLGVETIRFYERKGLIKKPQKREGDFRLYLKAETNIQEIQRKIKNRKQMGTSLPHLSKVCGEGEQAIRNFRVFDSFENSCAGGTFATTFFP
jgi:DNA-binding transcriptional MerR regulator